jgi:cytochrome c peroxidase
MSRLFSWLQPSSSNSGQIARRRPRWFAALFVAVLMAGTLRISTAPSDALAPAGELSNRAADEPITAIPELAVADRRKAALGERLFGDVRMSRDNSHSCASCHDLRTNGATQNSFDIGLSGKPIRINTLTVFNAANNFRYNWTGSFRTLEAHAAASIESGQTLGLGMGEVADKLGADEGLTREFIDLYGHGPDAGSILDAIASFERTLVTPGSKFDRWLKGDAGALTPEELNGYRLFKSLGCSSCHQGVNAGGNLFQRHGIFHPLASPKPEILRVPSLRNVATTAPYFHDGSAPTLEDAVRKMAYAQLNSTLTDRQVEALVTYLKTLTGNYRGVPVAAP